ncbi:MAG: hypothetical protein OQK50_00330 [Deltaproteobacteria bacterium]|nr:hypothetical protein [Deltaproteobacteria bacterium]MCW9048759.1 hypothetical protein [Deltaproteobacteria bacterium]
MSSDQILPLSILLLFAFASNFPLGYLRETSRKYSLYWFTLIHLSIPFIVILRNLFGFSWQWIPLTLICAVAGQLLGSRSKRKSLE